MPVSTSSGGYPLIAPSSYPPKHTTVAVGWRGAIANRFRRAVVPSQRLSDCLAALDPARSHSALPPLALAGWQMRRGRCG
jgi:hypothetical protein